MRQKNNEQSPVTDDKVGQWDVSELEGEILK